MELAETTQRWLFQFFEITDRSEPYVRLRRMRRRVEWNQHRLHSHTELQHERVKIVSWYAADTDHGARCVFVRCPEGHHRRQNADDGKIRVIEFYCTLGTDRPGDSERTVAIMVAADSAKPIVA